MPASWIRAGQVLNAGPERSWARARRNSPTPSKRDLEWRGDDAADLCVDVASDRFVDLANEAKREVVAVQPCARMRRELRLSSDMPADRLTGFWNRVWQEKGGGSWR